ncbi:MAG: endopeptidase La [Lachnospiraceae bacterium]|nr:endopeptidase La [Lachnospiraceae bacterium]
MNEEKKIVPVIALRGLCIIPEVKINFDINRKKSIDALDAAMEHEKEIFVVTQRNIEETEPKAEDLYRIGVLAKVSQVVKLPGNNARILLETSVKAMAVRYIEGAESEKYLEAEIEVLSDIKDDMEDVEKEAKLSMFRELISQYAAMRPKMGQEGLKVLLLFQELPVMLNRSMSVLPIGYEKKQSYLETEKLSEKYVKAYKYVSEEISILSIREDFQKKIREKVDTNQKEYILREQMKVIREELGEEDTVQESDMFLESAEKLNAPKEIKQKLKKEIKRYKTLSSGSSESNVSRGYIETLLDMPWDNMSKDNNDIRNARKILDRDHYGMEKVKERILEFLAVRSFHPENAKGKSPVICLVGPPGTGKTSVAKSVAEALNKKYVRICLGGVRDEAEIRGHRRTYVGAMPGRIVAALRNAGVKNPLMLLDEIDKIASDYKGDPASALLEVLDDEQNNRFIDHYVEVPVDLSEVFFIATANDASAIPRPLRDRMELIDVTSYTVNEKEHIAHDYLIKKQREVNGLEKSQFSISKAGIEKIIMGYTREAGVRNLERTIGKLCRKAVMEIMETQVKSVKITGKNIERYLGKVKYARDKANEKDDIGIVRGLAWTSVGGDTLEIEVNTMPGKGELVLTGNLGEVMKESAQTGISFIRANAKKYEIEEKIFKETDIHIHIPEGAVPKDGPSAGITMAAAVLSALTGKKIYSDIAMTGEITLRGRVLPIGGLKEKLLAAKTAGIKRVLVPADNVKDVEEISKEITDGLKILFVSNMEQVIDEAMHK